jgi:hypothetical protein
VKGKATVASADPERNPELAKALDELADAFTHIRDEVQTKALGPHIVGARDMGPGELFFQTSDRMGITTSGLGCDVQISRMSKTPRRSDQGFWDALDAFQKLCVEMIERYLLRGERMQLLVSFVIDSAVWNRIPGAANTNLIESDPVWIEGKA